MLFHRCTARLFFHSFLQTFMYALKDERLSCSFIVVSVSCSTNSNSLWTCKLNYCVRGQVIRVNVIELSCLMVLTPPLLINAAFGELRFEKSTIEIASHPRSYLHTWIVLKIDASPWHQHCSHLFFKWTSPFQSFPLNLSMIQTLIQFDSKAYTARLNMRCRMRSKLHIENDLFDVFPAICWPITMKSTCHGARQSKKSSYPIAR